MFSWDTNCIIESIKIGEIDSLHKNKLVNIYLENVLEELKKGKEKFLKDIEKEKEVLDEEYKTSLDMEKVRINFDNFIREKEKYDIDLSDVKNETIKEIVKLRLNFSQESGDFQIMCHANKSQDFTLITHDEKLFFVLMNRIKSRFLIEYIMENKIIVP